MYELKKRPGDVIEMSVVKMSTAVVNADMVVVASASPVASTSATVVISVVGSIVEVRFNASSENILKRNKLYFQFH